jgi:hypothetical protein
MNRETSSLPKCFISYLLIIVKKVTKQFNLGLWLKSIDTLTAKLKCWKVSVLVTVMGVTVLYL